MPIFTPFCAGIFSNIFASNLDFDMVVRLLVVVILFNMEYRALASKFLFLSGRPGSGKSTAARYIEVLFNDSIQRHQMLPIEKLNDYTFLREMYLADKEHKQFKPVGPQENEGFDVIDFNVLNVALESMKQQALLLQEQHSLILIEFARCTYRDAFSIFGKDFLHSAYFLFFKADIEICEMRIKERAFYPASLDDHFLSDDILFRYYRHDDSGYFINGFVQEYGIDPQHVAIIDTMGSWKDFAGQVKRFFAQVVVPEIDSHTSKPLVSAIP